MPDPQRDLAELLRTCVQCGLCLPHCATYLATGSEVQSPRGRLVLLDEVLAAPASPAPPAFLAAFDQCIGCRACEAVCPSGVPYSLLEHGHDLADGGRAAGGPGQPTPAVPGIVRRRLDQPGFLRLIGTAARAARGLGRGLLGPRWRQRLERAPAPVARLARLVGSVPAAPRSDAALVDLIDGLVRRRGGRPSPRPAPAPPEAAAGRLLFFAGCANRGLLPATSRRLLATLRLAGYTVETPPGQDCCGALAAHDGRVGRAATLQRRNRAAFAAEAGPSAPPIVVEAAGCSLALKSADPHFADRVVDPVTLLAGRSRPPRRAVPLTVALHDPCHARHGQGIIAAPRALLAAIPGLRWCEPSEPEVCCGSGGSWGLRYPEMSAALGRRKAADLAATGADLVVTTNPGCLGQIADGLALVAPDLPILPLTDLWWYAVRPADD